MDPKLKALLEGLSDEQKTEVLKALGLSTTGTADVQAAIQAAIEAGVAKEKDTLRLAQEELDRKALEQAKLEAEKTRKLPGVDGQEIGGSEGRPKYARKRGTDWKTPDDMLWANPEEVGDYKALVEDLQAANDDALLASALLHRNGKMQPIERLSMWNGWWQHKSVQADVHKAIYTGSAAGGGTEWVPTEFSPQWIEKIHEEGTLLPLFTRTITMNTGIETVPIFAGHSATAYLQGEGSSDDMVKYKATAVTTAQKSLTAKQIAIRLVWSQEFSEDAISGAMDYVRQDIANSIASWMDKAVMDGDTSATHQDTGSVTNSYDARKAFSGLRFRALSTLTANNVSMASKTWTSANNVVSILAKMGAYAGDDPVMLVSKTLRAKVGLLLDTANNLVASGQPPEQAAKTPFRGPLGIGGTRVLATDLVLDTYNASGIYDGTTTSYTAVFFVNPDAFVIGWRRGWTMEVEKDIASGMWQLVSTCRMAFDSPYSAATEYIVNAGYGLTASW